tara:strand:- start:2689 stop:2817 length:129 start_codon:yes stop_codon:yes gene_type:complete
MNELNEIAEEEFGIEYTQLGLYEQEWCRDELENQQLQTKYEY